MSELTINPGTHIGFSANKTVSQAIDEKEKNTNRLNICKSKELYMNGERVGLSDNEADYLKRKVNEEYNAKAGLSISATPTVQDAAAPATVTITVRTTWSGNPTDADAIPTVAGVSLTRSSAGVYTGTVSPGNNVAKTWSVQAIIKGVQKSANVTVQAYHRVRYGVSTLDTLSGSVPSDFKSKAPQWSAAGTYDFAFKANTYAFILIPQGVTLPNSMKGDTPSGVEGPLPVPFVKQSNLVVGSVTYTVLRIADKQAESVHNVVFK